MIEISKSNIQIVAPVPASAYADLKKTLNRCHSAFSVYRKLFADAGVTSDDIINMDPFTVLAKLPIMEDEMLQELAHESLQTGSQIIDIETSSGTTGDRKRRFISYEDDVWETEFLSELFKVCGIGALDRVACLDTDPLTLMMSFTKALHHLGVDEAYCYSVGADFDGSLQALPKLDPSVIVTVPSVMERCFAVLSRCYDLIECPKLKSIIYAGEPLTDHMRTKLEYTFGVEVFGYYGASETSALGMECTAHDGVHLFTDRNLIELLPDIPGATTGEIIVTTLCLKTMPLLRYRLGDLIQLRPNPCPCGRNVPRAKIIGRFGDSVSILGSKLDYSGVVKGLFYGVGSVGFVQMVLDRKDRERLTVVLSQASKDHESKLRENLLGSQPDLDFLVGSGYLDLEFRFVEEGFFGTSRKVTKIIDLRYDLADVPDLKP